MAGCPRVTHPSATKSYLLPSEEFRGYAPFDLHVLSTPPAFILSQDQTLDIIYLPRNFPAGSCPLAASRSSDEFDSFDSGYKTSFSGFLFSVFFTSWFSFFLNFLEVSASTVPFAYCFTNPLPLTASASCLWNFSGLHYCLFVKVLCLVSVILSDTQQ